MGRRPRPDHLRRASDRVSRRCGRHDDLPARDPARLHVPAVRTDFGVLAQRHPARHRGVLRASRRDARKDVAFAVDLTLHNVRQTLRGVRVSLGVLVGQRVYGEPEREVSAVVEGGKVLVRNEETGAARWWGGSREPAARRRVGARAAAAARTAHRPVGRRRAARRRRPPSAATWRPHASSARLSIASPSPLAPVSRCGWPSPSTCAGRGGARPSKRSSPTSARCTTRRVTLPRHRRRALFDAVAGDQPRRGMGEGQHAAHRQTVSEGWGATNSPPSISWSPAIRRGLCTASTTSCPTSAATRSRSSTSSSKSRGQVVEYVRDPEQLFTGRRTTSTSMTTRRCT